MNFLQSRRIEIFYGFIKRLFPENPASADYTVVIPHLEKTSGRFGKTPLFHLN